MIIITGASRGLGKAISDRLSSKGFRTVGLARSFDAQAEGENIECDVADYASVKEASRKIKALKTPVEAIINAAGIASMNMVLTTNEQTVRRVIETNLMGTIFCCQLFGPILARQKNGQIINFSTIAVPLALKGEAIYAASKAGVETFSRTMAREMADFNVRINCIAPGPIQTDLLRGITEKQIKDITDRQVIQKQFTKDDLCDLIEVMLDSRSSALSGQVLNVGGV